MKRVRIQDERWREYGSPHQYELKQKRRRPPKPFCYVSPETRRRKREERLHHEEQATLTRKQANAVEASTLADPTMLRLMNDIQLAKRTEREAWNRLARYLATGVDRPPPLPRVRIRKETHD